MSNTLNQKSLFMKGFFYELDFKSLEDSLINLTGFANL
jgi:hypothetical protein